MLQLDLFGELEAELTSNEHQQADWHAWLKAPARALPTDCDQGPAGQVVDGWWQCPACGDIELSAATLHQRHGFSADLNTERPFPSYWLGPYLSRWGCGCMCWKLRLLYEWARYRARTSASDSAFEEDWNRLHQPLDNNSSIRENRTNNEIRNQYESEVAAHDAAERAGS
ncbi:hypothetical protein ACGFIF_42860 [Kribbella sp. NPDC049174]|uniref:hypothetical protein n=1 Tax=Kribbella sp. NPDC049174 TaxID=3364112 RepID=UPI003713B16C